MNADSIIIRFGKGSHGVRLRVRWGGVVLFNQIRTENLVVKGGV